LILPDANLLIYAYHPRSPQHEASRDWLVEVLNGPSLVGLTWNSIWAFLRIITNQKVFESPLTGDEATSVVDSWLERPNAVLLEAGPRHWEILSDLITESQAVGPLVADAALAALAIEHGATLHTTDRDFARFAKLNWANPIG
jgi:uncharacterized protein